MAETCNKSKPQEEDLISQLPDEILIHVLSYVDTNSAVATSFLSKRWKLLWVSVPNLEFGYNPLIHNCYKRVACFGNLVDRVLSLNNVMSVRNVKLDCHSNDPCDVLRVTAWVKSLVMRKAEKCALYLPVWFVGFVGENILLPDEFFIQKNLRRLCLTNVVVKVPSNVCFPCLKTITLANVPLVDDESMTNLLFGCSAITDLDIWPEQQQWLHHKKVYFRSSTLQNLNIAISCDEIVIDAPNLRYLRLDNRVDTIYEIISCPYLVKASLAGTTYTDTGVLYELLRKISHVKELVLDKHTMTALRRDPLMKIAMLHNLTHITLSTIKRQEELDFWLGLLTYTPNGISIIFKVYGHKSLNLPHSIISCIESVKITRNGCEWKFMSVVACNLKGATGSKKLLFYFLPTSNMIMDFLKKLSPAISRGPVSSS